MVGQRTLDNIQAPRICKNQSLTDYCIGGEFLQYRKIEPCASKSIAVEMLFLLGY